LLCVVDGAAIASLALVDFEVFHKVVLLICLNLGQDILEDRVRRKVIELS
jgi:hypothetical protein